MTSVANDRATCWSITINNPTKEEIEVPPLPAGWKLEGQIEVGEQGTEHFQGMLTTPQVRFSAVKRHLPRAHIEIARDKKALQAYVHKEDTRVREVQQSAGLTVFALQDKVLELWNDNDFKAFHELIRYADDAYLRYADCKVRTLITEGMGGGIEYVAINPMWRTSWKKFGEAIVQRFNLKSKHNGSPPDAQAQSSPSSERPSPSEEARPQEEGWSID